MRRASSAEIVEDYFRPGEQQKQEEQTQHAGGTETKTSGTGGQEMKRREDRGEVGEISKDQVGEGLVK